MTRQPPRWLLETTTGKPSRFEIAVARRLDRLESTAENTYATTDELHKLKQEFIVFLRKPRKGASS